MNRRQLRRFHPSSFILHRSAAPRRAFTLVELLVVIVIIGMLAALITAAAAKAVNTAKRTQITLDLDQFETAFQSYRNDTSGNFPPDMSYPPQTAILASYQVRQNRIMAHLRKAYPRALIQGYGTAVSYNPNTLQAWTQTWFSTYVTFMQTHGNAAFPALSPSGDVWGNVDNLDPAEALVFWLGGMPLPFIDPTSGKWSYKLAGVSANKQAPFGFGAITAATPSFPADSRTPGPYEFSPARLGDADGDGWPEYYPPGAAVPQPPTSVILVGNPVPPYVYFDAASYDFVAFYDSTNTNGWAAYPSPYPMNAAALNNGPNTTMTLQPTAYISVWGLAVPYAAAIAPTSATTGNITWVNDKKFQVISAGIDTLYCSASCATNLVAGIYYRGVPGVGQFPLFPTPQVLPALPGAFTFDINDAIYGEPDNQANFTSGTLQDGSTQ